MTPSTWITSSTELHYPPVHLKLALDLYSGPRLIQAEGLAGKPTHYARDILQGCPQAQRSQSWFCSSLSGLLSHTTVALQTWVGDVSFDIKGTNPDYVAREAVLAFRTLHGLLEEAGLKVNKDKTGFLTSSKESAKALQLNITEQDPQLYNALRDLGADATAARL